MTAVLSDTPSAISLLDQAVTLHQGGQFKASVPYYIHAVRQAEVEAKASGHPVNPDVLHAAGVALAMAGKRTEAVEFLETAIRNGKAKSGAVWSALGLAYVELRQLGRAERCYRMACQLDQASCANWTGYANLAAAGGNLDVAERRYRLALNCQPRDAEELIAQGMTYLRMGHWRKGWRAYEARYQTAMWHERNPHASTLKLTADLAHFTYWRHPERGQRVLVVTEQGLGDAVQFARYVPEFAQRFGVTCVVQAHDALVDLISGGLPGVEIVGRKADYGTIDGWVLMLSLPALLKAASASDVPPAIRPFGVEWGKGAAAPGGDEAVEACGGLSPASPRSRKVFVHSRGNAQHGYDFDRSAPPDVLEQAVRDAGFDVAAAPFMNLAAAGEVQVMAEPSWRDTVDLLMQCDACVTVDTGLAHVAGSLGIPTFLCVPTLPEWRWGNPTGSTAKRTPWYPSAVLGRRTRTDRWHEMAEQVHSFLGER